MGAERIVLSRELSLKQIARIRSRLPENVQLEAFVHGAMCMSHSGRCMLSDYLTGRSANRGACTQPCRWEYTILEAKRPDEPMPVLEDERGTYIFSAYDLNMLSYLPEMRDAGIASLKIEGRMKTEYYVAAVTRVYRAALDLLAQSESAYRGALPELQEELLKVGHRESNTGFYFGAPRPASGADKTTWAMTYAGRVLEVRDGRMLAEVKNRFSAGEQLELLTPAGARVFTVESIFREDTGESVPCVTVAGHRVWIPVPFQAGPGDYLRKSVS
jgi:putative protease